jgi:hypothetical protein
MLHSKLFDETANVQFQSNEHRESVCLNSTDYFSGVFQSDWSILDVLQPDWSILGSLHLIGQYCRGIFLPNTHVSMIENHL